MRMPVLAPGMRVLRRSRHELQVGLGPGRRVVLTDTEPVRRTLAHLTRGEALPDDPDTHAVLDDLAPVLVTSAGLVSPHTAAGDVAAAALQDPAGYEARLAARHDATVLVSGTLGPAADPRPLLAAAGLGVTDETSSHRSAYPAVALLLCTGEIDRAELDPLVRGRIPHLVVRMVEGAAVVGPLVDPGRTACLRCIDAHCSLDDPLAAVLAGLHALARGDRHDGVAEPVDTALATLAVAWAVRDLVTHVEGDRSSTWSSTVRLAPALASVTQTEWWRHPACGCNWLADEPASRTIGA